MNELTPAQRQRLGRIKGGMAAHAKHPDLARRAGSAGGKAFVRNNPQVHQSSHGRQLAMSRRPRWELNLIKKIREEGAIEEE